MAVAAKDLQRYSDNGFFDDELSQSNGELFELPSGDLWNSRNVAVLHNGLDTVKQLYQGLIDKTEYLKVQSAYDSGSGAIVEIGNFQWKVGSGRRGGYRYSLQNKNIGLVILLGSFYLDPVYHGHHLKIECSPNFLLSRSIEDIQGDLDLFASYFISQMGHTGVAVHLCADLQGWECPNDLDFRLTTKAKRVFRRSGISEMEFDHNDLAMVYGKAQSFTFGSVSTLQFAVYDKSKAVRDKNELELWVPVWSQKLNQDFEPLYDAEKQIFRAEARFHHSVIQQFASGSGFTASNLLDLGPHLSGLWRYALNNFRLDCPRETEHQNVKYIDPLWQFLRDDLQFHHEQKLDIDYKRLYKAPDNDGAPNERTIMICFGQLASIYGRNGYTASKASQYLMSSGIWVNLVELYRKRNKDEDDIFADLVNKLEKFNR